MKTRSKKNKGKRLQNYVAKKISEVTGIEQGKDKDIESRPMSQAGTDVILRGKALELFQFSVECSNSERWDVHGKIKQSKANRIKGTDWLCFFKRNREKPIAVLEADVFFEIFKFALRYLKSCK